MGRVLNTIALAVFVSLPLARAQANEDTERGSRQEEILRLREQVGSLKAKLEELERRLRALESEAETQPRTERGEEERQLEREIEAALERPEAPPPSAPEPSERGSGRALRAISRAFNPAISVNGLFAGGYLSRRDAWERATGLPFDNGLNLQEVEGRFTADVDPFLRADLTLTFDQEGDSDVEEAFVKLMQSPWGRIPSGVGLRTGKFLVPFGRHNLWHSHQWPFIDQPLANNLLFGEEGIGELGAEASYLLPASWYSEITLAALAGDNENLFGGEGARESGAYLAHLKNFFDLGEATTFEVGQSYLTGKSSYAGDPWTHVAGFDLTLKWRPLERAVYRSLVWQTEGIYLGRDREAAPDCRVGGIYSYIAYQFARLWWLQFRYDNFASLRPAGGERHRWTTMLALVPSEFSAVRLQYAYATEEGERDMQEILLQLNYTIGSHPAHNY